MEPTNAWLKKNSLVQKNGSNVTTNTKITSSHLLASNYVPNNLKAINTAAVSVVIQTKALPSLKEEIDRVYYGLVADDVQYMKAGSDTSFGIINGNTNSTDVHYDHPAAVTKMDEHNKQSRQDGFKNRPIAIKTVNEASFVTGQVRKRLESLKLESSQNDTIQNPDITGTRTPTNEAAATTAQKIPSIGEGIPRRQEYLDFFRELLQVEHAEIQRRFREVYDNYKIKITTPLANSTQGGKRNNGVAQFSVMGIADGRPSIRPGDTVLIRPHKPIYVPMMYSNTNINYYGGNNPNSIANSPYSHTTNHQLPYLPNPVQFSNQYSQEAYSNNGMASSSTIQMVEVVSRVLAVKRGHLIQKKGRQKKDQVLISWVEDPFLDAQLKKHVCAVRFVPSTAMHERSLTALNWLRTIDPLVARDLLFPSESPKLPPPPAIEESDIDADTTAEHEYEQLNVNQARFVEMVTSRTAYPTKERVRPPMILTGPAGTGKTKTLLAAILEILRMDQKQWHHYEQKKSTSDIVKPVRSRILVCTPSHTACDVITQRLVELLVKEAKESLDRVKVEERQNEVQKMVFRLYDATRGIESVPAQILPYTRQSGDGGQFALPQTEEMLGFSVIVCTCQDAHLLYLAGLTNSSLRQRRNCLKLDIEHRLQESGLELRGTIEGWNNPHFTHLFLDEAAQATEPECLIPLSVVVDDNLDTTKVEIALCGDPRQLGPLIYSPNALVGLQRSLLERLLRLPVDTYGGGREHMMGPPTADSKLTLDEMIEYSFQKTDYREHLSVFLNLSYRGHPSFLFMPSKLFYFDKLKSICKNDYHDTLIKVVRLIESESENAFPESMASKKLDWPILFRGVKGRCTSTSIHHFFGSNCWCNHAEADVVVKMIGNIIAAGISTASIGVMAAFRAQVVLIRKMLRDRNLGNINVGTVEDYQSMERHIIILSLTRANKSLVRADMTGGEGLFHQPKRMNVALTRAERMLVVVGDPNTMSGDSFWTQWLEFCKINGLWYGEKGKEQES